MSLGRGGADTKARPGDISNRYTLRKGRKQARARARGVALRGLRSNPRLAPSSGLRFTQERSALPVSGFPILVGASAFDNHNQHASWAAFGPRQVLNAQSQPQTFQDVCPASRHYSVRLEAARNTPLRPFKAVARVQIPLGPPPKEQSAPKFAAPAASVDLFGTRIGRELNRGSSGTRVVRLHTRSLALTNGRR
jgi:hypothetical protein